MPTLMASICEATCTGTTSQNRCNKHAFATNRNHRNHSFDQRPNKSHLSSLEANASHDDKHVFISRCVVSRWRGGFSCDHVLDRATPTLSSCTCFVSSCPRAFANVPPYVLSYARPRVPKISIVQMYLASVVRSYGA